MSKYVAVLPWVYKPWRDLCLKGCKFENVLEIDNSVGNIGVASSWNRGIDYLKEEKADWLIIMSAALRFGESGGLDFAAALDTHDGIAVEAGLGIGWHLIAFHRNTIKKVGRFDENFYPAYYEDIDYSWRIHRAYDGLTPPYWAKVNVDVAMAGWGHGVTLTGMDPRGEQTKAYMLAKWGALTVPDMYDYPFNNPNDSLKYWPSSEWTHSTWDA